MHLHKVLLVPRIYLIHIMFRSTCPTSKECSNQLPYYVCILFIPSLCACVWLFLPNLYEYIFFYFKHNKMYFCIQPYTHTQITEHSCINWMHRGTVYSAYSCILLFLLHINLQTFSFSKLQIRDINSSVSRCNVQHHDQSWHKASWFNGFQKWIETFWRGLSKCIRGFHFGE